MLRQALKANVVSYNAVFRACEKGKELRRVLTFVVRRCCDKL